MYHIQLQKKLQDLENTLVSKFKDVDIDVKKLSKVELELYTLYQKYKNDLDSLIDLLTEKQKEQLSLRVILICFCIVYDREVYGFRFFTKIRFLESTMVFHICQGCIHFEKLKLR